MAEILNIEKLSEKSRLIVETGLLAALKKGSLGGVSIDFIQIETSLSGGKTGAAVFVAKYGRKSSSTPEKNSEQDLHPIEIGKSEFIRVLKIASKEICLVELKGFLITQEKQLDLFSQVGYFPSDEFSVNGEDSILCMEFYSTRMWELLRQEI
ncbi:MAG: hypothetical protein H7A24_04010 [Leptospiraceae bacterium]|nr:hypothetical protein [Leptospiraceae bacterium]